MTNIDPRIIAARGFTADAHSVTVVTQKNGETRRVASFAGSNVHRALIVMAEYHQRTGRYAWLARGTKAAFLPFADI